MWLKASTSRRTQIKLDDLIAGSVYEFRIKAENPYGVSLPSCQSEPIRLPALRFDFINTYLIEQHVAIKLMF